MLRINVKDCHYHDNLSQYMYRYIVYYLFMFVYIHLFTIM